MPHARPTVLVFGTFDVLHPGHRDLFAQAAKLGTVTAVVARDASVKKIKGFLPHHSERSRLARVSADPAVSRALLGDRDDFLKPVQKIQPGIIALGYDQRTFRTPELRTKLKAAGLTPKIVRLRAHHPKKYKSSKLRP